MNDAQDRWNTRYAKSELVWSAGPNQCFAEIVEGMEPGVALDVATGEGRNALWLAEQGWEVDAIDFSAAGIEKAKQIAAVRKVSVNWIVDDVSDYAYQCRYDLVAVLYLHTSAVERQRWFERVAHAVVPGGSLIYIAHDPANIEAGIGGPQDPSLLITADEVKGLLPGFRFERAGIFERSVAAEPGHGKGNGKGNEKEQGTALDTCVWAIREAAD